jgi:hypothetical protein
MAIGAAPPARQAGAANRVYGPEPGEGIRSFQKKRPADWRRFRDGQGPEPA